MDIISLFGLILTVAALILAFYQQRSANSQTKELSEIRHSLSTQYIGQFPDYIPNVVSLIQSARKKVLIAYGQVTFGIFSYREKWLEYRAALEQKLHEGITIDLLCLDERERRNHQVEQFSLTSKSWEEKLNEPQFKMRLEIFAKHYTPNKTGNVDRETFLSVLEHQQKKSLEDDFTTAIKTEVSSPFAMHFWIVDGSRAIFTVPNFAEGATELGFFTSDARLIKALESIHTRSKIRQVNIQKSGNRSASNNSFNPTPR
jgi:hypothetical protein